MNAFLRIIQILAALWFAIGVGNIIMTPVAGAAFSLVFLLNAALFAFPALLVFIIAQVAISKKQTAA